MVNGHYLTGPGQPYFYWALPIAWTGQLLEVSPRPGPILDVLPSLAHWSPLEQIRLGQTLAKPGPLSLPKENIIPVKECCGGILAKLRIEV